jgi:hypothetical protein
LEVAVVGFVVSGGFLVLGIEGCWGFSTGFGKKEKGKWGREAGDGGRGIGDLRIGGHDWLVDSGQWLVVRDQSFQ